MPMPMVPRSGNTPPNVLQTRSIAVARQCLPQAHLLPVQFQDLEHRQVVQVRGQQVPHSHLSALIQLAERQMIRLRQTL